MGRVFVIILLAVVTRPCAKVEVGVDTLVFDIDDTMYPASSGFDDHRTNKCIKEFMTRRLGFRSTDEARALWKEYIKRTHATIKALKLADQEGRLPRPFNPEELAAYWAKHCEFQNFLQPNLAFVKTLEALSPKFKLAVFTNSPKMYAMRCLDALGVRQFFPDEHIFCVDDLLTACKPRINAFKKVFYQLKCHPRRSVMFEDSIKNLRAAKSLGMCTVLIDESLVYSHLWMPSIDGEGDSIWDDPAVDIAIGTIGDIEARIPELWKQQIRIRKQDPSFRGSGFGKGGPVQPLSFDPEVLPERSITGRRVAFQHVLGTPWRLFGAIEDPNSFRWDRKPNDTVSVQEKQEIRAELEQFAFRHGIPLTGDNSVRVAMLNEGNMWVSYSGGISSNPLQMA